MLDSDLINYYKSLIIFQYSAADNALATVEAYVTAAIQDQILSQVRDGFDVDTALGAQLTILGTYRGLSRVAFGAASGLYWSLPSVNDTLPGAFLGWASVSDADADMLTIRWLQVNDTDSVAYTLTDTQLRRLIELKSSLDAWDGTLETLDNILFTTFGVYVNVVDNLNMSIIYQHQNIDPDPDQLWSIAVLENVFPHPAGVGATFVGV